MAASGRGRNTSLAITALCSFMSASDTQSVTVTIKIYAAATVGVPLITPVAELIPTPLGRLFRGLDQVYV